MLFRSSTFTGEINTPYSKQFVHSKSSQYRRLKTEWKNNVYLARSRIQGLGLYAAKDLEKHTMVIEYIGTIIRNEVANRREKIYEEQVGGEADYYYFIIIFIFSLWYYRAFDLVVTITLFRFSCLCCLYDMLT